MISHARWNYEHKAANTTSLFAYDRYSPLYSFSIIGSMYIAMTMLIHAWFAKAVCEGRLLFWVENASFFGKVGPVFWTGALFWIRKVDFTTDLKGL